MRTEILERLKMQGYAPRTLLDVGAHVGSFTTMFLQTFPHCRPTLIEPNPYCEEALAQLPFERHMVAASCDNGEAELFLTREWLQSTGTSLYRENSPFFRDEVVMRQPVTKARLDDLLPGRRFDFVKIDTQGAELDVLRGGAEVIRHADHVVLEVSMADYNPGSGRAEEVFAVLADMGFIVAETIDVFRYNGEPDGRIMQIDYLFEQSVKRPSQSFGLTGTGEHQALVAHLTDQKARHGKLKVLQVGPAPAGWPPVLADAVVGAGRGVAPLHFEGDLDRPEVWSELVAYAARHGRFGFCVCADVLQKLRDPEPMLRALPLIADAGFIATPSRYLEASRAVGPWRGRVEHNWIADVLEGETLILVPKIGLLEHLAFAREESWVQASERFELQVYWRGALDVMIVPAPQGGAGEIADRYVQLLDRP